QNLCYTKKKFYDELLAPLRRACRMKKHITTIILTLILLTGLGLMLYPSFSNWWNKRHQTQVVESYKEAVDNTDKEKLKEIWNNAVEYNKKVAEKGFHLTIPESEQKEYESELNLNGDGIMGYISIPTIKCELPIYHGTDEAVLQIAIGHLEGSSLPVGGENVHTVVSGHRGLPSSKLFTDLDKLSEGDIFIFHILDQTLTYQVDQIRIIIPEDFSELQIEEGKDYCTLVTCTPYGINTHRLLVRGHRVPNDTPNGVENEAVQLDTKLIAGAFCGPLLIFLLIMMIGKDFKERGHDRVIRELRKDSRFEKIGTDSFMPELDEMEFVVKRQRRRNRKKK
ncbi:MAG: class C sortase, partial [Anaerobutyricum sp.]|nr:class C sortase [Anaerobutyricum sp.]